MVGGGAALVVVAVAVAVANILATTTAWNPRLNLYSFYFFSRDAGKLAVIVCVGDCPGLPSSAVDNFPPSLGFFW